MQSAGVSLFYQHAEEKHAAQLEEKSRDHKNRRDRYLLLLFTIYLIKLFIKFFSLFTSNQL